jgi:hypothetical protein
MTDAVKFRDALFLDSAQPIVLEDSIRKTAAYAGVHDFDFLAAVRENFSDTVSDWTDYDSLGWSISSGYLTATGGGGSWYRIMHPIQVSPSFVASFDTHSGYPGAFLFRGKDSVGDCYIARWSSDYVGFSRLDDSGDETQLMHEPVGVSGNARIQVAVRFSLDSIFDDRKFLLMSMFVDGNCVVGYGEDIGGTAYDWDGNQVGFAINSSNTIQVDNFRIADMHRIVEWTSIDPGETAATGMMRAIANSRIGKMCRYDGTLRIWRPGDRSADFAIPDGRPTKVMDRQNMTETATHIRMLGAIYQADAFDDTEGVAHMHRFKSGNDPNLMSEGDTYTEAWRALHDEREGQTVAKIHMPPNPCLETHDRVSFDGSDWRILGINTVLARSSVEVRYVSVIDARKYLALGTPPDRS